MNDYPTILTFDRRDVPPLPMDKRGGVKKMSEFVKSEPREWTDAEVEWLRDMKAQGFTKEEIAESMGRTETSIAIKLKRIGKTNEKYNEPHRKEKYAANQEFEDAYQPLTVLDAYCGKGSWWKNHSGAKVIITNDADDKITADYHLPAERFMAKLYADGLRYELIDLDPFGSAYDCFDLALRMAQKAIIVTFGEMGHKRWKRLDFVRYRYGIENLSDFTTSRLIDEFRRIGWRHKKDCIPIIVKEWPRISRVYFEIRPMKITEQWE